MERDAKYPHLPPQGYMGDWRPINMYSVWGTYVDRVMEDYRQEDRSTQSTVVFSGIFKEDPNEVDARSKSKPLEGFLIDLRGPAVITGSWNDTELCFEKFYISGHEVVEPPVFYNLFKTADRWSGVYVMSKRVGEVKDGTPRSSEYVGAEGLASMNLTLVHNNAFGLMTARYQHHQGTLISEARRKFGIKAVSPIDALPMGF
jgi:hypothetical protein